MRTFTALISIILLVNMTVGCKERLGEDYQVIIKEYGKSEYIDATNNTQLDLNRFKDFKALLERTEEVVCNGGVPQITIEAENHIKTVYLHNPCWDHYDCILIYERNTFRLHNDSIYKAGEVFPLARLTSILKKDIENNGADSKYSDSPQELIFLISYDGNGIETLPNTLIALTDSYEMITHNADIVIWLDELFKSSPSTSTYNTIDADK